MNYQEEALHKLKAAELVERFGHPLYAYSADKMREQYHRLSKALQGVPHRINYACKALNNIQVLALFHKLGSGLDTVSIEEVKLGLHAGFAPGDIIFTPNGVGMDELVQAVDLGVRINIDNLQLLEHFGTRYGGEVPVCIRINPHIQAGGHSKISVGHIDSKFGISIHQQRHLQRLVNRLGIQVNGVHMHTGSDILDVDVFLRGAALLLETAAAFPQLEYLDFGSGFKVPYKPGDIQTDIEELGEKMQDLLAHFTESYGRQLRVEFEPGKFLVSEAGFFICKVNALKQTTATVFAQVHSGLNHMIRPMFYDAYHHISNASRPEGRQRVYSVVGYICETDTFATDRLLPEVAEGDLLVFHNAGAYCYTMSNNYNSRLRPAEVMLDGEDAYLIRRRETFEDLLATQQSIR